MLHYSCSVSWDIHGATSTVVAANLLCYNCETSWKQFQSLLNYCRTEKEFLLIVLELANVSVDIFASIILPSLHVNILLRDSQDKLKVSRVVFSFSLMAVIWHINFNCHSLKGNHSEKGKMIGGGGGEEIYFWVMVANHTWCWTVSASSSELAPFLEGFNKCKR